MSYRTFKYKIYPDSNQREALIDIFNFCKNLYNAALEAEGFEVDKANIQDASWGKFVNKLTYKAESADKLIIKVDPQNISKMCSCCGKIDLELTLRDREYHCKSCGLAIDRDINAAKNIKALGTSAAILKSEKADRFQKHLPKS